jgi:NDP-sugar pyrophosphorylase family protein
MRAIILAGGKGSRLRPFTLTIPKPLVPIGDLPILEILIRQLHHQGFDQITISVGHLASLIQAYCGHGERWGIPIDYVFEDRPLGTIGCLSLVPDLGREERVLVVNGDTLTDLDMGAVYRAHDVADAITLCASRRVVNIDFGVLEVDGGGRLTTYAEKPVLSYRVSMGVNILSGWTIEECIPKGERLDLPELVQQLLAAGRPVRVVEPEAYWQDLGRVEDLETGGADFEADPKRFLPG